ncbi:MAG: hypothetical protein PVI23_13115 [Maricaulaceae bacterium]|jgi:hypothetical protein
MTARANASPEVDVWPITDVAPIPLDESERKAVDALAERLRRDEPMLGSTDAFGPQTRAGYEPRWPRLAYEDHRAVTFVARSTTAPIAYRAFMLAGEGDIALVPAPRDRAFEAYYDEVLGLGAPSVIEIALPARAPRPASFGRVCRDDATALGRIVEMAKRAGGLNVAPYLVDGESWLLARAVGEAAQVPVCVAGPPPRLARRANDKLWFANRVVELLGPDAAPPTFTAFGPAAAAGRIAVITRRGGAAVVKAPASAAGLGNMTWTAERAANRSVSSIAAELSAWLFHLGWDVSQALLVGVWDAGVTASPSAQVWIPSSFAEDPIVEGVFLQETAGDNAAFVGARPAKLAASLDRALRREATLMASLFQKLGYVGRCSFDAVVFEDQKGEPRIHWIECNARWGGVSMPMTLVNRLTGDWRETPFIVAEAPASSAPSGGTSALLKTWSELLYCGDEPESGVVLIGPPGDPWGFRFIAIGSSISQAQSLTRKAVERLGKLRAGS